MLCFDFLFRVLGKLLLKPILAVYETLDDEGDYVVAGCVYHRRGGIDEVADGQRDGECDRKLIGEEKITVLPDAISIPPYTKKKHGVHKILFLGRICKTKGIGELLAVMPKLKEKYPDVQLYLGGIFEDKELEQQAYALKDQVTCLSWVTGAEKEKYLRECDIFVLPSYFEGQSIAILEAMANCCAVVASRTGGIPQMIIDGETGILIEPRSESSLQEGMEKVLSDDDFAARLGERAREKAAAEFSIENNMERLIHLYEGL